MRITQEIRRLAHRFGVDVVRYPLHDRLARTVKLLRHHDISCVVDVGANDGGFAAAIRGHGYTGRIISFEPLQQPYTALRRRAAAEEAAKEKRGAGWPLAFQASPSARMASVRLAAAKTVISSPTWTRLASWRRSRSTATWSRTATARAWSSSRG